MRLDKKPASGNTACRGLEAFLVERLQLALPGRPSQSRKVTLVNLAPVFRRTSPASAFSDRRSPIDNGLRFEVLRSGFTLADLWESSPVRLDSEGPDTEDFVDSLFPSNPLLCVANDVDASEVGYRDSFRGRLARLSFIAPATMPSTILTSIPEIRLGSRSLEHRGGVEPRTYAVVESEYGSADDQSATLKYLDGVLPLVLVVQTGIKGLQGWFAVSPDRGIEVRNLYGLALRLGAHPVTGSIRRFARMPGAANITTGRRQTVWFFNPGGVQ